MDFTFFHLCFLYSFALYFTHDLSTCRENVNPYDVAMILLFMVSLYSPPLPIYLGITLVI